MEKKEGFIIKYRFQIIIGGIFLTGLIFIYIYISECKLFLSDKIFKELGEKESVFNLRNIIIGLAAFATAIFTWWKNVLNAKHVENAQEQTKNTQVQLDHIQKQILIQEESRLDSLFAKAVELLKEDNDLITRIGGVHTLKDLAVSSPKHTQKCIDMLCSLNETWMPEMLKQNPKFFERSNDWVNNKITDEVLTECSNIVAPSKLNKLFDIISLSQSVLKSISFIIQDINEKMPNEKFDLSYKYLCSIDLSRKELSNFEFVNSFLNGANLLESNIQESNLLKANLQNAYLERANLQNAKMISTNLKYAKLYGANFQETNLTFAILDGARLDSANFQGASFFGASFLFCQLNKTKLQGADLFCADLRGTNFEEADLNGTNLTNANIEGALLTNTQFDYAVFLNTHLLGSEIKCREKQTVFYKKDYLFNNFNFSEKTEEEFRKYIEENIDEELKSLYNNEYSIYINRMINAYEKNKNENLSYNDNEKIINAYSKDITEENYSDSFTVINELNNEFIYKRNNFAIQNKSFARCMLTHKYSIFRETSPLDNLNTELTNLIKSNKPDWYEEFKKEGVIKEESNGLVF
jgi:uncharacterized protein YjbI with pentapeptide repeats